MCFLFLIAKSNFNVGGNSPYDPLLRGVKGGAGVFRWGRVFYGGVGFLWWGQGFWSGAGQGVKGWLVLYVVFFYAAFPIVLFL